MNLATLLPKEAVLPRLNARDKKQALRMLAVHTATLTPLSDREIYSVILDREQIGCTGMGNGVAIPHGRFAGLSAPLAVFATLMQPVEFGAADHRPVDLVFLLLTPATANTEHLKALAIISMLMRDKALCERLRKAPDAETLYDLLIADSKEND